MYAKEEMNSFWEEYLRLDMPHVYKVDLSKKLHTLKIDMIDSIRKKAKKDNIGAAIFGYFLLPKSNNISNIVAATFGSPVRDCLFAQK